MKNPNFLIIFDFLYLICSLIPIIMYLFWKYGCTSQKFKVPLSISALGAFIIYFMNFTNLGIFIGAQNLLLRIVFFFLLCFLIAIMIIIFTAPTTQIIQVNEKHSPETKYNISNGENKDYLMNNYEFDKKKIDLSAIPKKSLDSLDYLEEFNPNKYLNQHVTLKAQNDTDDNCKDNKSLKKLQNMFERLYNEEN